MALLRIQPNRTHYRSGASRKPLYSGLQAPLPTCSIFCPDTHVDAPRSAQSSSIVDGQCVQLLRVMIVLIMIDDQAFIVIQIVRRIRLFNSVFPFRMMFTHARMSCSAVSLHSSKSTVYCRQRHPLGKTKAQERAVNLLRAVFALVLD